MPDRRVQNNSARLRAACPLAACGRPGGAPTCASVACSDPFSATTRMRYFCRWLLTWAVVSSEMPIRSRITAGLAARAGGHGLRGESKMQSLPLGLAQAQGPPAANACLAQRRSGWLSIGRLERGYKMKRIPAAVDTVLQRHPNPARGVGGTENYAPACGPPSSSTACSNTSCRPVSHRTYCLEGPKKAESAERQRVAAREGI